MTILSKWQSWILLFLAGFIFGPIGDYSHILSGTTAYPEGGWLSWSAFPIPLWVPWEFGFAAVAVALAHFNIESIWPRSPSAQGYLSWKLGAFGLLAFLGQWVMSGFLPGPAGGTADLVMAAYAIILCLILDRSRQAVGLGLLVGVAGTLVEIALVQFQVFLYHPPKDNLFGVPSWLPFLYVSAAVAIAYFTRLLFSRERVLA